tara:strand:+ start:480 stop:1010 length:531 start_codon:yes stop_codon:yes gene_type:complete
MRIAFTGAQSTGKTTLLNKLKHDSDFNLEYEFIDEITRRMTKKGLKINEGGDDMTQLLIMNSHISNILKEKAIMDRCALDGVVYTRCMYEKGQIADWVMDFAENVFTKIIDKYDYIFYLSPEFEMEDDGVRSVNKGFQMHIVKLFEQYILECEVPVIHLSGTVEERIKQIKETINE